MRVWFWFMVLITLDGAATACWCFTAGQWPYGIATTAITVWDAYWTLRMWDLLDE